MASRAAPLKANEEGRYLKRAAEAPLALIHRHLATAHWRSEPLFEKLSESAVLFDSDLDYKTLLQSTPLRGDPNLALIQFRKETQQGVWEYVEDRRAEVARFFLERTNLLVWQVTDLAGFATQKRLRKALKRLYGLRPSDLRNREQGAMGHSPQPEQPLQAREESPLPSPGEGIAEAVWARLRQLPYDEQRTLVRAIRFNTQEFVDLLGKQYLIASRRNRQCGVEIAELALLSVEVSSDLLGELAHDLRGLAYAWLSNANRMAFDYPAAQIAITNAEKAWATPRKDRVHFAGAMISLVKGSLCFYRRSFNEAEKVLTCAIRESRLAGAAKVQAQSLILRAAVVDYARLPRSTFPDLRCAIRLLRELDEPRLTLGTHLSLAYALTSASHYQDALAELTQAWALWEDLPETERDPLLPPQLEWNAALARHALGELDVARGLYEASLARFLELEESEHAAIVALDLARLCYEVGDTSEVLALASKAFIVLDKLGIPEAYEAVDQLRKALARKIVGANLLELLRATLVRFNSSKGKVAARRD